MHASYFAPFLAVMLLTPAAVIAVPAPQLIQSIVLPGFAQGIANVSSAGVEGSTTTYLAVTATPAANASADVATFTGTATILVGGNGQQEDKFQLPNGNNVDEFCSFANNTASCSAVVSGSATTFTTTFATAVPTVQGVLPAGSGANAMGPGSAIGGALVAFGLAVGVFL